MAYQRLSTGLPGLDDTIKGLAVGDNVVWRIGDIADYSALVRPLVPAMRKDGREVVYIRFAEHEPLLSESDGVEVLVLRPQDGFEHFLAAIHATIARKGLGAAYVFDCITGLVSDWYSDQMLGNFFTLTCPYLYDLQTIAYFALLRHYHSSRAFDPIFSTTQIFIDVFRHQDRLFLRPGKVQHRYAQTMGMLHALDGDRCTPVQRSDLIAEILHGAHERGLSATFDAGLWDRTFMAAERLLADRCTDPDEAAALHDRLLRMALTRDPKMLALARRFIDIDDMIEIRQRMIGTGLIGGKSAGMLIARAIIRERLPELYARFEAHDSYYVGSDVFYTYLVNNGVWWVRQNQRNPRTLLEGADQARQNILTGRFPDHILRQFDAMLDYFGQSPIIVRSSSLLEDNFGNSFAGKYDSVFCANQGPRERRLDDFLAAVRVIYTSSMSDTALRYRAQRGLLEQDEQMALLVMRVSGSTHGPCYYPHLAGVGFSWNPYAWSADIDPAAGVARLVFGLGTRAVDRSDDDYTRVVALNDPRRRPESNFDEVRHYAQRRVDFLDLEANQLISSSFDDLYRRSPDVPADLFVSDDPRSDGRPGHPVLTLDGALARTRLVEDLRSMLATLQDAYTVPVDTEFTVTFADAGEYRINLVQCRPLPITTEDTDTLPDYDGGAQGAAITARGAVIGCSRIIGIDRFIYVHPPAYGQLHIAERHEVARVLGRINRHGRGRSTMLIGPGRWGTSTPSLGIPVRFADISNCRVLCEVVAMREDLVPDVSLGTHFLNELIEEDIVYLALFPKRGANRIDEDYFLHAANRLPALLPDDARWQELIRVIDPPPASDGRAGMILRADAKNQSVICYRHRAG
ncbi:MAG: PEP/pyruvate-binding domain-containing protein [Planctomycetota bacterium]